MANPLLRFVAALMVAIISVACGGGGGDNPTVPVPRPGPTTSSVSVTLAGVTVTAVSPAAPGPVKVMLDDIRIAGATGTATARLEARIVFDPLAFKASGGGRGLAAGDSANILEAYAIPGKAGNFRVAVQLVNLDTGEEKVSAWLTYQAVD